MDMQEIVTKLALIPCPGIPGATSGASPPSRWIKYQGTFSRPLHGECCGKTFVRFPFISKLCRCDVVQSSQACRVCSDRGFHNDECLACLGFWRIVSFEEVPLELALKIVRILGPESGIHLFIDEKLGETVIEETPAPYGIVYGSVMTRLLDEDELCDALLCAADWATTESANAG